MTDAPLASRAFSENDQLAFARLSRDWNPMHLDANFARRTQPGAPVVHGIHMLLWAMDALMESFSFVPGNIKVRFQQPLYVGEIARIEIRSRTATDIGIDIVAADTTIAAIKLASEPGRPQGSAAARSVVSALQSLAQPVDIPFDQLATHTGAVAADANENETRGLFPALSDRIGLAAVRGLLATSAVVGMACPGLHSLFAGLDVNLDVGPDSDGAREAALAYAVSKTDVRFRSLQIDIGGSGLTGKLDAFARLPPPVQPGMATISARVAKNAFAGQRALIIGGSRGLGEVTARIIAAGGGYPLISYRDGRREAETVAAAIKEAGGPCDILRYDVLEPAGRQLDGIGAIDCAYYFATARIFQRRSALFEPQKLRTFLSYYADGFYDLCTVLAQDRDRPIRIFYPSSVAIDDGVNATAEYAMAKGAGEILAKYINDFLPHAQVIARRLPRIMTDQTATIGVAGTQDALDALLPIVYEVQQTGRP